METKYIALICFGILSLFLCLFSAIFTKTEKTKIFITLKGLAGLSYITLALVGANLNYKLEAFALFVALALIIFMFSSTIRDIPTKTDMFHTYYTYVASFAFAFMTISLFFQFANPLIGLLSGFGASLILLLVYLLTKKKHQTKDKIANIILFLFSSLYLGMSINYIVAAFSVQSLIYTLSALSTFVYVILQNFTHFTTKKYMITKNIFLGVGLILAALTIFFI